MTATFPSPTASSSLAARYSSRARTGLPASIATWNSAASHESTPASIPTSPSPRLGTASFPNAVLR